jgi:hypothetical protein
MNKFIQSKIETVYGDFCEEAKKEENLCTLKDFSFAGAGRFYKQPLARKFYTLKYVPAYLAEYSHIYGKILKEDFLPQDDIDILSLGCGCGVDYWGFHFAAQDRIKDFKKTSSYTGFDLIEWEYRESIKNKHVYFFDDDIGTQEKLDYPKYNIYFFPKSISDFPERAFNSWLKAVKRTKIKRTKIVVACSFRTKEAKDFDDAKVDQVVKALSEGKNKFKQTNEIEHLTPEENLSTGLNQLVPEFSYPSKIRNNFQNNLNMCNAKDECPNKTDECDKMNYYPVTTQKFVNYTIRFLTRQI